MTATTTPPKSLFHRSILYTGSGAVVNLALLFLETVFVARWLSRDNYGIYVLLVAVVNFLIMLVDFGGKTAVTQMLAGSDKRRQTELTNSVLLLRLAVLGVIGALLWLGHAVLVWLDPTRLIVQYTPYLPLMLAVASLDELLFSLLQGFQAYRPIAAAQILRSVLRLTLTLVCLSVYNLGILALLVSWIISFGAAIVVQFLALPVARRPVCDWALVTEMLRFGFPLQLNRFLWFLFRRLDILLLGWLAGPVSVAHYSVAARIPDALQSLSEAYISVYFPTIAALLARGNRRKAVWMLNQSLRLISFAAASAALAVVVFSQPIILLVFSDKYLDSHFAFGLLMLALHMTLLVNLMGYTVTAAGYPGRSLSQNIARSGLHLVGDLLLIPLFGFVGPAYATLFSTYAVNPFGAWLLRRSQIDVVIVPYVKQTVLLLGCAALFWWLQPVELIYRLGILIAFAGLNLVWGTIAVSDAELIVPGSLKRRAEVAQEPVPPS